MGEKTAKAIEQPHRPAGGHISSRIILGIIWSLTVIGLLTSIWTIPALILEPFYLLPAVPAWFDYLQPIITVALAVLISDPIVTAAGIQLHLLSTTRLAVTVYVWIIMAFWTSCLFLQHFVGHTIEYSNTKGKDHFLIIGLIEGIAVLFGWGIFADRWTGGHVFMKKWADAAWGTEQKSVSRS